MLDLYKTVRDYLLTQSNVTDLLGERIYMAFSPNTNVSSNYPFINLDINDGPTDSLTNDYRADMMIHIWTKGDARVTRGNEIAKELILALDRKAFLDQTPGIYQILKEGSPHEYDDDLQIYHKVINFSVVMEGYGGPSHPCDGA